MYVVLQSDSIQDLGRSFLVWVYPFNHQVKQPPEWLVTFPKPGREPQVTSTSSLPLSLCCVSVSGPVTDVFINLVVKAEE